MNTKLGGISLHVDDVEKCLEFYLKIPGAALDIHRPGEFARLLFGNNSLHLVKLPIEPRFHIEFDTDIDLNQYYDALVVAGLTPDSPPKDRPWGKSDFRIKDPNGNHVEFSRAE